MGVSAILLNAYKFNKKVRERCVTKNHHVAHL